MNVLHVLTTGTSLIEWMRRREEYAAVRPVLAHDGVGATLLAHADVGEWGRLDLAAVLGPVPHGALASGDPAHSAEWTSVHHVRLSTALPPAQDEAFLLLASDTDEGLRAAVLVAAGYDPAPVHYVHEPLDRTGWIGAGEAWVCRVPRLDLSGDPGREPDGTTWRSLGAVGALIAETVEADPDGWTVVVHFSAGYKAVVPYVMVLAEAVRSRLPDTVRVRAVAYHDSEARRGDRVPVEVPVRRLGGDLWAEVAQVRAALRPDTDVVPAGLTRHLRGLLLDRVDERRDRVTVPGLICAHVVDVNRR